MRKNIVAFNEKSPTVCQNNRTRIGMTTMRIQINVSVVNTHPLLSHLFQNIVNEQARAIVT